MKQELSHDSIARLNCALPITKTISVIRQTTFKFVHLKIKLISVFEIIETRKSALRGTHTHTHTHTHTQTKGTDP